MLTLRQLAEQMSANVWFKNPFKIQKAKGSKSAKDLSSEAKRGLTWLRHFYLLHRLPTSIEKLSDLEIGELRLIAKIFKAYDHQEMLGFDRPMLIQFICSHQQDVQQYHPLPPLPYGSLPPLD